MLTLGCAASPGAKPAAARVARAEAPGGASELSLVADWNDVQASVLVAVPHIEAAVLSSDVGVTRQVFQLRTIADETGWLDATRLQPERTGVEDTGESVPIRLRCRIGRGDPVREQRLLEAVARRLADLRGVDYRRLRD